MLRLFFFNATATPEIYTLSLHDALPISNGAAEHRNEGAGHGSVGSGIHTRQPDRKSTRLNSSHTVISYAVFCLKKKIMAYLFLHGKKPEGRQHFGILFWLDSSAEQAQ